MARRSSRSRTCRSCTPPRDLRLSPDGGRLALTTRDAREGDLWVYYLDGRPPYPLTDEGDNVDTVWSPDGTRVAFSSDREGVRNLFWMPADGSTLEPERLLNSPNVQYPRSWSPDGELFFEEQRPETGWDIFALPLEGEREPRLVVGTEYNEQFPQLSPSGRWLAYMSDVTGRYEIWVRPYPGPGTPLRISTNGGALPVWARDGRELFYLEGEPSNSQLMAVAVDTGLVSPFESARVLVDSGLLGYAGYDVAADGRFVAAVRTDEQEASHRIEVVLNWFEELKRLAPSD